MRRMLIVLTVLTTAGCLFESPQRQAEADARDQAERAAESLSGYQRIWSAQDMGHRASEIEGVEVMRVSGTDTQSQVRLVIRTTASAWPRDLPREEERVTVKLCFELRFEEETRWDVEPREVRCPAGRPLTFAPWPKDPEIPDHERLKKALPRVSAGGRADETKVRKALASLRLDPKIRVEIQSAGGVVGVALVVKPYLSQALDCTFIRVAPGKTSIWAPSRMQRMPGESGCGVGHALSP